MDKAELCRLADEARKNSYCIYSGFSVGAALLTADGRVYKGCNIENASYGATICAERCAVFAAVSSGRRDFTAIAITGSPSDNRESDYAYPCGMCRQVLREFVNPSKFKVIVARSADDHREYTLDELLPNSFGPDNLKGCVKFSMKT